MSNQPHDRFDLSELVLGYLEETGSVVMPPAFGIYEVLIADDLAAYLNLGDYARLTFTPASAEAPPADVVPISVNHPLVESIAQVITQEPANARAYIGGVRLDKRGLAELAQKQVALPNARLDPAPKALEEAQQHHYLLCNFKVTFVSEEKQEELVAVVMDVQAGHAVRDATVLQHLDVMNPEPTFAMMPNAQPRWPGAGADDGSDLAPATLQALLPRAERALRQQLTDQVTALTARMGRHLTLDLARINDYYDEMAADLQQRQRRHGNDTDERQQSFADKLTMLAAERSAKLQDARSRYGVRVEMALVNVLLVAQPKIVLPVVISNRTATITRTVVWDPLVHRLESFVCDVCGEPGEGLHLCTGGHLAHAACLAPQCIDCKRAFCQLCAAQVKECVVCHRPVCAPSLVKCPTCGQGTCREHQQLCHTRTENTQTGNAKAPPATRPDPPPTATAAPSSSAMKSVAPPAVQPSATKALAKGAAKAPTGASKPDRKAKSPPPPVNSTSLVKGVRINVEIHEQKAIVVAFVMRSTNRVLATRSFELTPNGLLVRCQCEKTSCPANGYYHRPYPVATITQQIEEHLRKLQQEYLIPAKKVDYYRLDGGQVEEQKQFALPAVWHDPARVREAMQGFDQMA